MVGETLQKYVQDRAAHQPRIDPLIAALARSGSRYSTSVPRTYFRVIRPLSSAR